MLTTRVMNGMFHEILEEIRVEHKTHFLGDVLSRVDIEEKYNVYRSFRQGSDSRAICQFSKVGGAWLVQGISGRLGLLKEESMVG